MRSTAACDVVIVGGGLIGSSLACALATLPLNIAVIDTAAINAAANALVGTEKKSARLDTRSVALSDSSRRIFQALDLWTHFEKYALPIHHINISQRGHFGATHLHAADCAVPAFGYVIAARRCEQILQTELTRHPNITLYAPAKIEKFYRDPQQVMVEGIDEQGEFALQAKLMIAADGTHSTLREQLKIPVTQWNYQQHAIAFNVGLTRDHQHTAFERFTTTGPLAILPVTEQQGAVILVVTAEKSAELSALSDSEFIKILQAHFGYRLGRFAEISKRQAYPLQMLRAAQDIKERFVLLGNAAHTLHPIAAQGFNLGLRDVATLAQTIAGTLAQNNDIGSLAMLQQYQKSRIGEQRRILWFTDFLARIFQQQIPPVSVLRSLGLLGLEFLPGAKKQLARFGMGHFADLPWLALGVPLV